MEIPLVYNDRQKNQEREEKLNPRSGKHVTCALRYFYGNI